MINCWFDVVNAKASMVDFEEPAPPAPPPVCVVPVYAVPLTVCDAEPENVIVPIFVHKSDHSVFLSFDVPPERLNVNVTNPPALKKYLNAFAEANVILCVVLIDVVQDDVLDEAPLVVTVEPEAAASNLALNTLVMSVDTVANASTVLPADSDE